MKPSLRLLSIIICLLLFTALPAAAARHGFFIDLAEGSGDAEWDWDTHDWNIDTGSVAVGYVYDSDPTPDQPFNFRLNVGLARLEIEDDYNDTVKSDGVYLETIFGFAAVRTTQLRWWLGPLLRIGYYHGEGDGFNLDLDFAEFAVGAATGLNIDLGGVIIAPSLGVRFSGYAGEGEDENHFKDDWDARATSVFFNIATLF